MFLNKKEEQLCKRKARYYRLQFSDLQGFWGQLHSQPSKFNSLDHQTMPPTHTEWVHQDALFILWCMRPNSSSSCIVPSVHVSLEIVDKSKDLFSFDVWWTIKINSLFPSLVIKTSRVIITEALFSEWLKPFPMTQRSSTWEWSILLLNCKGWRLHLSPLLPSGGKRDKMFSTLCQAQASLVRGRSNKKCLGAISTLKKR